MKKNSKLVTAASLALVVALTACGKQAVAPQGAAQVPAATAGQPPVASNATVLGALNDADWYMVVSAQGNDKPLVIQAESKPACEQNVAEFSLKALDPESKVEPPKAWCMNGKEVRAQLRA